MKAVIMAGGKGTRLQGISKDIPKPMFPVNGKPVLEYQIENLKQSGIDDIIIVVGHLGELISEYFGNGTRWNVRIEYVAETEPLGTAGSFYYLREKIESDFLLVFGDLIFDVDFRRFISFHADQGGLVTLLAHPNSHPFDSDLLIVNDRSCVDQILPKYSRRDCYSHNLVNSGLYCIGKDILKRFEKPEKTDLERDVISDEIMKRRIFAYRTSEYVKDVGTPERMEAVESDIQRGIVSARSLKRKQKAVFLDRDGTINKLAGFLRSADGFELLPAVAEAIRMLNGSEYLVIIITNQPVIARGEATVAELDDIHKKLETELGREGAYIDGLFYCPHHPDKGFEGEIPELKTDCGCRKPKIGMLLQAAEQYNIELKNSWFIGDSTTDVQTGYNAGMRTILLRTGEAGKDGRYAVMATYEADDLKDAVDMILECR